MRNLSVRETRAQLGKMEELLEAEGEIVVTRRGRPIARVLPPSRTRELPSREEIRKCMPRVKIPSEILLREERDAR